MGILPQRGDTRHAVEAAPRALCVGRLRGLLAGALRAAPVAAELQAVGAVALFAHAAARSRQHRKPHEGADRDRRWMVLLVVQRLLAGCAVLLAPAPVPRRAPLRI